MPAVVRIIAGIALIAASFFIPGLAHLGLALMMAGAGASIALGGISQIIQGKPNFGALSSSSINRTVTIRQPLATGRVIYGSSNIGGVITYLETTGSSNEFLEMVITLAAHELASIDTMQFDGVDVPLDGSGNATGTFAGLVHVEKNLGTRDQAAFSGLVSASAGKWTSAHRQRGRAGIYIKLKWDQAKFTNGVPNITFNVTGRKVRDPRRNLLVYSQDFSNAAWSKAQNGAASLPVVTHNFADLVDGQPCEKVAYPSSLGGFTPDIFQPLGSAFTTGQAFMLSFWARTDSTVSLNAYFQDGQGHTVQAAMSVTNVWQKFTLAGTLAGTSLLNAAVFFLTNVAATNVYFRNTQFETGAVATEYGLTLATASTNGIAYSNNSALALADYLENPHFGLGAIRKYPLVSGNVANSGFSNFNGAQLVDGDLTTNGFANNSAAAGSTIQIDLGVGNDQEFIRVFFHMSSTGQAQTYTIQYSDDNSAFFTAASGFKPDCTRNDVALNSKGKHRYWHIAAEQTITAAGFVNEVAFYTSLVDTARLVAAATCCDEPVALAAGGSEPRYATDGAIESSERPVDVVTAMAGAMAGYSVYVGGKFFIYPGKWRVPDATLSFNEDDLVDTMNIKTRASRRDIFNTIRGTYISAAAQWQPTNFPSVSSSTYIAEDSGEVIYFDATLPFTISNARSQRISKISLNRVRRQVMATVRFKLGAYRFNVCDVITFSNTRFGWVNKTFEIQSTQLVIDTPKGQNDPALMVDAILKETDSNVYDWNPANDELTPAGVSPISVFDLRVAQPVTGLAAASHEIIHPDSSRALVANLSWTSPTDQFVIHGGRIHVYFKLHTDSGWTQFATLAGDAVLVSIPGLTPGASYDYKVVAENTAHVFSADTIISSQVLNISVSGMLTYRPLADPLTAHDAGSDVTVNIASFTMRIQGVGDKSIGSGSVTGLSYNTLVYIYYDDATLAGGGVTFFASSVKEAAINALGRFFVGSIQTPRATAPDTIGNNDGGSGAQQGMLNILNMTLTSFTGFFGGNVGNGAVAAAFQAIDNDLTSAAALTIAGSGSGNGDQNQAALYLSGPAGVNRKFSTLTLRAVYDISTDGLAPSNIAFKHCILAVSFDGGGSWTFPTGAAFSGVGSKSISFPLPVGQNPALVVANFFATSQYATLPTKYATSGSFQLNVREVWLEGVE